MCMVQKPEEQYKMVLQVSMKKLSKLSGAVCFQGVPGDPGAEMQPPSVGEQLLLWPSADGQWHSDQHHGTWQAAHAHPTHGHLGALCPLWASLHPTSHEYYDSGEFIEGGPQEAVRMDKLEYEEVELCKNIHQDQ